MNCVCTKPVQPILKFSSFHVCFHLFSRDLLLQIPFYRKKLLKYEDDKTANYVKTEKLCR